MNERVREEERKSARARERERERERESFYTECKMRKATETIEGGQQRLLALWSLDRVIMVPPGERPDRAIWYQFRNLYLL